MTDERLRSMHPLTTTDAGAGTGGRTETVEKVARLLIEGDLSRLTPTEKAEWLVRLCESLGLNPWTRPFEFIKLGGKEVLYAKRDATEQLRRIHHVSLTIVERRREDGDIYVVKARATLPDGRTDEATGAVAIGGLRGEALANAYMIAETKAKRRVTLSICGLGFLDESEVAALAQSATPTPIPVEAPTTAPPPDGAADHGAAAASPAGQIRAIHPVLHVDRMPASEPNVDAERTAALARWAQCQAVAKKWLKIDLELPAGDLTPDQIDAESRRWSALLRRAQKDTVLAEAIADWWVRAEQLRELGIAVEPLPETATVSEIAVRLKELDALFRATLEQRESASFEEF